MLEVHEFEYVAAGGNIVLLRLAGLWTTDPPAPVDCPLLASSEAGEEWFEPLPQKWGDDRWRAAWSAPIRIVEAPDVRFLLVPPSNVRIELPHPIEHGTSALEIAAVRAELEQERERSSELEALLDRLRGRLAAGDERLAEIERLAEDLRAAIRPRVGAAA